MTTENIDLSNSALILIDVINDLDFPGNEELLPQIPALGENLKALANRARKAQIPVIYLNDHFGKWRSDFNQTLKNCLDNDVPGRELARLLTPEKDDYFVLKPMHSGFYGTPLQILLNKLDIKQLILTGIAADICVLYTANDAYMRQFNLMVVSDGVAANTLDERDMALKKMNNLLKANIVSTEELLDLMQAFLVDPD